MTQQHPRRPPGVTIRPATEADTAAYRTLRLAALKGDPQAFSSNYESNLAKPASFWEERLRASGTPGALTLFFAVREGRLIGMCGVAPGDSPKTRHSADIVSVYVRPKWRGQRIAEILVTAGLDWARTQGVRIAKLGVSTANTPAIRCYTRCGFAVYGIEPQAIYHDGVFYDELLMSRPV